MGMHTGDPCFLCREKLREEDDVVVCPECGTPYHRACWNQNGACVNLSLHASGGSWQKELSEDESSRICSNCGTENAPSEKRCRNCGVSLEEPLQQPSWQNSPADTAMEPQGKRETFRERMQQTAEQMGIDDHYCGMDQEEQLGDERLGDVADFIAKNQIYYLPKFLRFQRGNHRISVNCPCLFFPHLYFAYRKMWPLALILAGVFALMQLPQMAMMMQLQLPEMISAIETTQDSLFTAMYPNMQEMLQNMLNRLEAHTVLIQNMSVICNYLDICLTLIFGLLGNWMYYRHTMRQVQKIRAEGLSGSVRRMRLREEGGTNGWLIVGTIALEYAAIFVLMAVLLVILLI